MKSENFKVKDKLGIHVRVACEIVDAARNKDCELFAKANEKDMIKVEFPLQLLSLQVKYGDSISFTVVGKNEAEEALLAEIRELIAENLS